MSLYKATSSHKSTLKSSKPMRKVLVILGIGLAMVSCNVTRVVETKSEYFTKGDTTCTIVTKTIESYDATKKLNY